jgi:hypothetical protein
MSMLVFWDLYVDTNVSEEQTASIFRAVCVLRVVLMCATSSAYRTLLDLMTQTIQGENTNCEDPRQACMILHIPPLLQLT